MGRPLWQVKILKKFYKNSKYYPWLLKVPILTKIFQDYAKDDKIFYLTKDRVIKVNQSIDKHEEMILPSKIVEIFIKRAKYLWILNECFCRDAIKCKKYPIDLGCLFLGEAVLDINPLLGRLVTQQEALDHVKACREAGLIHQIGRNRVDAFWLNVGPENKLMTICSCCECCCLAKISINAPPKIKAATKKMPGVEIEVTEHCIGCGRCTQSICPFNAISLVNNRSHISEDCHACGRCIEICPNNAIKLNILDTKFADIIIKDLELIMDIG